MKYRKLGLVFCSNHPAILFSISQGKSFSILRGGDDDNPIAIKSLRFNPELKTLIWLERDLSSTSLGCHQSCFRLMTMSDDKKIETVIDIYENSDEEKHFAGIYLPKLPKRCFFIQNDNVNLLFSTVVIDTLYPVCCNLFTKEFSIVTSMKHGKIVDCFEDNILVELSTPASSPQLKLFKIDDVHKPFTTFGGLGLSISQEFQFKNIEWKSLRHRAANHPCSEYANLEFSSIIVKPKKLENAGPKIPLILWPHGGPVSIFPTSFNKQILFLTKNGFGVLLVNFRGSTGLGQKNIDSLFGYEGNNNIN